MIEDTISNHTSGDGDTISLCSYTNNSSIKKKYIWDNEIPIIERKHKEENLFTFCISVAPVDYHKRLQKFASYKNGKVILPESGNARAQFCIDFVKEVIETKFLKK